jgi:hypothetical protein
MLKKTILTAFLMTVILGLYSPAFAADWADRYVLDFGWDRMLLPSLEPLLAFGFKLEVRLPDNLWKFQNRSPLVIRAHNFFFVETKNEEKARHSLDPVFSLRLSGIEESDPFLPGPVKTDNIPPLEGGLLEILFRF